MPVNFIDKDIVCPFYQKVTLTKIHCEGIDQNSNIQLHFINKQFQQIHEAKYCMNIEKYKKCPLYTIIARQYQDMEV